MYLNANRAERGGNMDRTDIYIGLNNKDSKIQEFTDEKYISILKKVCISYKVPFSFSLIEGGYIHENGEYTQENTLMLSLIGTEKDVIEEIAQDLCVFFDQESVLIASSQVEVRSISNRLKDIG